jgi:hypothetical protein
MITFNEHALRALSDSVFNTLNFLSGYESPELKTTISED